MKDRKNRDNRAVIAGIMDYCGARMKAADWMIHEIKRWHGNGHFTEAETEKYCLSWQRIVEYNRTVLDTASELMNYLKRAK